MQFSLLSTPPLGILPAAKLCKWSSGTKEAIAVDIKSKMNGGLCDPVSSPNTCEKIEGQVGVEKRVGHCRHPSSELFIMTRIPILCISTNGDLAPLRR